MQLHKQGLELNKFKYTFSDLSWTSYRLCSCSVCTAGNVGRDTSPVYPSYIYIIFLWALILSEFGGCITWYRYNKWREIRVAYAACALQARSAGRIICIFSKDVSSFRLCTCIGSFSHFAAAYFCRLWFFHSLHLQHRSCIVFIPCVFLSHIFTTA